MQGVESHSRMRRSHSHLHKGEAPLARQRKVELLDIGAPTSVVLAWIERDDARHERAIAMHLLMRKTRCKPEAGGSNVQSLAGGERRGWAHW